MRRLLLLLLFCLLLVPGRAWAAEAVPGRVVVGFEAGAGPSDRARARAQADAVLLDTLGDPGQQLLKVTGDRAAAIATLERDDGVAFAEPDYLVHAQWTPNDQFLGDQWALAATRAPEGWDLARGAGTLVGVVDSGVDIAHPDLGRVWTNFGEVAANGLDDDGNGRIDDLHGYDFANGDGDPTDDHGHGTSVTGVIAASTHNALGVAGVAPEAVVAEAKALSADGTGPVSAVADGMRYLATQGARVVNLSLGGQSRSWAMATAIADHPQTLFVVAAGNDGADNDAVGRGTWPCNDSAPNVICVGATRSNETRAAFSNWGNASVDLMAPGESVLTTTTGGGYGYASGTSFSAPMVTGAAALVFSRRPSSSVAEVREALLATVAPVAEYAGITTTGGRLDVLAALQAIAARGATAPVPATAPAPAPAMAPGPAAPLVVPRPAPAARTPARKPATASTRCGTGVPHSKTARTRRARCERALKRQRAVRAAARRRALRAAARRRSA